MAKWWSKGEADRIVGLVRVRVVDGAVFQGFKVFKLP